MMVFDRAARDLNIIERHGVVREFLISLVPLARDQDDVARLGDFHRASDRLGAVRNFFIMIGTKAFFYLGNNSVWILLARIIRK